MPKKAVKKSKKKASKRTVKKAAKKRAAKKRAGGSRECPKKHKHMVAGCCKPGTKRTVKKAAKKVSRKRTQRKFLGMKKKGSGDEESRVLGIADKLERQAEHLKNQRVHREAMEKLRD